MLVRIGGQRLKISWDSRTKKYLEFCNLGFEHLIVSASENKRVNQIAAFKFVPIGIVMGPSYRRKCWKTQSAKHLFGSRHD